MRSLVDYADAATLDMFRQQDHEPDRGGGLDNPRSADDEPETEENDTEKDHKQIGRGEPD